MQFRLEDMSLNCGSHCQLILRLKNFGIRYPKRYGPHIILLGCILVFHLWIIYKWAVGLKPHTRRHFHQHSTFNYMPLLRLTSTFMIFNVRIDLSLELDYFSFMIRFFLNYHVFQLPLLLLQLLYLLLQCLVSFFEGGKLLSVYGIICPGFWGGQRF